MSFLNCNNSLIYDIGAGITPTAGTSLAPPIVSSLWDFWKY
ncbi:hypothetical protein SpCBS45565_g06293 [Spizellomyces sp. 'palustris']|nr:hypothetical protein SpCBS45565_g06293 [Spizellomyces sp. 'palustris']